MADLAGTRATVMGLGRFGGGVGVTRWLASQGADILVTDEELGRNAIDWVRLIDRNEPELLAQMYPTGEAGLTPTVP